MVTLTPQQNEVFEHFQRFMESDASVFILRGYAGTGKTTMLKQMAEYVRAHYTPPVLMAPTGRAAKVLAEKTGLSANTIHVSIYKLSHLDDKTSTYIYGLRNSEHRVIAIIDEASMVASTAQIPPAGFSFGTNNLLEDLVSYTQQYSNDGKLIFIGDPIQLPPVGDQCSNALRADYFRELHGFEVYEAELTEVIRQANESAILRNATKIRTSFMIPYDSRELYRFVVREGDVEAPTKEQFLPKYFEEVEKNGKESAVILTSSNAGAMRYNRAIRKHFYGAGMPVQEGDILLVLENNYRFNLFNGESVTVQSVGEIERKEMWAGKNEEARVMLTFRRVSIKHGERAPISCYLIDDLFMRDKPILSKIERDAILIDFKKRHKLLKQGTDEFNKAWFEDDYTMALRATYGYAMTAHKSQGGEWHAVFVDYAEKKGANDEHLRWAYTATTRARDILYVLNLAYPPLPANPPSMAMEESEVDRLLDSFPNRRVLATKRASLELPLNLPDVEEEKSHASWPKRLLKWLFRR